LSRWPPFFQLSLRQGTYDLRKPSDGLWKRGHKIKRKVRHAEENKNIKGTSMLSVKTAHSTYLRNMDYIHRVIRSTLEKRHFTTDIWGSSTKI